MPGPAPARPYCDRAASGSHRAASGSRRAASGSRRAASGCRLAVPGSGLCGRGWSALRRSTRQRRGTRAATRPAAEVWVASRDAHGAFVRRNLARGGQQAHQQRTGQSACQPSTALAQRADAIACRRPGHRHHRARCRLAHRHLAHRQRASRAGALHWAAQRPGAQRSGAQHSAAQRPGAQQSGAQHSLAGHSLAGQLPAAWTAPEPALFRRGTGSSRNQHRLKQWHRTRRHRATCPGRIVRVAAALW
jgi:hypothetical protein